MKNERMRRWVGGIVAATALLAIAGATTDAAPALGSVYRDAVRGFSIQPPAGQQRRTAGTISWFYEDPKTRLEIWSFTVAQQPCPKSAGMKAYAGDVLKRIRTKGSYRVSSARLGTLAGREIMDIQGVMVKPIHLWQRQVWVSTGGQTMLVFLTTGPTAMKDQLIKMSDASLATLTVTDSDALQAQAAAADLQGKALLAKTDARKLSAAVRPEPQWFLMYAGDRVAGYLYARESVSRNAVVVATVAAATGADGKTQRTGRWMFTGPSGRGEQWQETLFGPRGKVLESLRAVRRDNKIEHQRTRAGKTTSQTIMVHPANYLPQAVGWLLPRLVSLKTPASYAFSWDVGRGPVVRRTFTVGKVQSLIGASGDTAGVQIIDSIEWGNGAQSTTLWVGSDGRLLRMRNAEGLDLRAVSAQRAAEVFGSAPATVKELMRKMSVPQ